MHRQRFVARLVPVLVATLLVVTGCGDWLAKRRALAKKAADEQRELALIKGYYSADIREAEQSLLGLAEYYSTLRVDGVEGTLGLTHTRLFLLYSQWGRTNDAARHRSLALKVYRSDQTEDERWAELLDAVARLDANQELKWKTRNEAQRDARHGIIPLDEAKVLAIARRAVATNDTWVSRAEFETPKRQGDGS